MKTVSHHITVYEYICEEVEARRKLTKKINLLKEKKDKLDQIPKAIKTLKSDLRPRKIDVPPLEQAFLPYSKKNRWSPTGSLVHLLLCHLPSTDVLSKSMVGDKEDSTDTNIFAIGLQRLKWMSLNRFSSRLVDYALKLEDLAEPVVVWNDGNFEYLVIFRQITLLIVAGVARVEVEIMDLNDNLPEFEVDFYNISIVENLPNGFSVLQIIATDQDQGDNAEFSYQLEDKSGAFTLDSRTGWLTVRDQTVLDREKRSTISMRVYAKEKVPSVVTSQLGASSVNIEVTLLDANDNNPTFIPNNLYEFMITTKAKKELISHYSNYCIM
ncbi:hypothetical protein NQ315_012161 [Exocentrus adspersus]|uniref:Cadherin domain-containing protein n=1 Tax=Exocentrus adspersus TaxID=1586481 RepID=A0AAV8VZF1_9CUCU|nr:hypothetical protein NQ315_012161 [Exocentrus adspersus]